LSSSRSRIGRTSVARSRLAVASRFVSARKGPGNFGARSGQNRGARTGRREPAHQHFVSPRRTINVSNAQFMCIRRPNNTHSGPRTLRDGVGVWAVAWIYGPESRPPASRDAASIGPQTGLMNRRLRGPCRGPTRSEGRKVPCRLNPEPAFPGSGAPPVLDFEVGYPAAHPGSTVQGPWHSRP
jgi:hypothetical protein